MNATSTTREPGSSSALRRHGARRRPQGVRLRCKTDSSVVFLVVFGQLRHDLGCSFKASCMDVGTSYLTCELPTLTLRTRDVRHIARCCATRCLLWRP